MLPIVKAPNAILLQIAKPVPIKSGPVGKIDKDMRKLIAQMKETLSNTTNPEGIGLAAPQVGKSLKLFIIQETPKAPAEVFINPVITPVSEESKTSKPSRKKQSKSSKLEGCLSLPNIWGIVNRTPTVTISYLDEHGNKQTQTSKGFKATILQHEYDHLQGVLFPKKVLEQKNTLYKSKKNKKGEDEFEELEV